MTFLTLLQNRGGATIITGVGTLTGAGSLTGTASVIARSSGVTVPKRRFVPRQPVAAGRRHPGVLPNWETHAQEVLAAIEQLPEDRRDEMRAIIAPLVMAAQEQATFNRMQRAQYDSLPAPHAPTHLGGSDNLISLTDPSPLSPYSTGDPGNPHLGASAGDHVHDMSAFLAFFETFSTVYDPELSDIMQDILFTLRELRKKLRNRDV